MHNTFHSISKTDAIINESDIGDMSESISVRIISDIQKPLEKVSGWIIDSAITLIFKITIP